MKATHKKLIVAGTIVAVIGVLLSAASPSAFQPLYQGLGPNANDSLLNFALGIIIIFGQTLLTPFGAMLAAIGVALNIIEKEESNM